MQKLKFTKSHSDELFYTELKGCVNLFIERELNSKNLRREFWFKALACFLLCWGSYAFLLTVNLASFVMILLAILFGFSGLIFGFSIGHDAAHRVVTGRCRVDNLIHFFSFITIGIDPTLWQLRHLRSHHMFPNVSGSDIDIDHNPFFRFSEKHPLKKMYKFQHIYAPFAYSLALLHSLFWRDWVYLFSKEYEWMRKGINKFKLRLSFILHKITHITVMFVIPYLILDVALWQIILVYILMSMISSLIFVTMLVGTHFFDEASYPDVDDHGRLSTSWAVHNLETSCDWNPDSIISAYLSGGANSHAAHHLFPNLCHIYYRHINFIIAELTEKYDIKYHRMSLWDMMKSHFRFLKRMGRE